MAKALPKGTAFYINYALHDCASCGGSGQSAAGRCAACDGEGGVLVAEPFTACPRCDGSGKAPESTPYLDKSCPVCAGAGWALVVKR